MSKYAKTVLIVIRNEDTGAAVVEMAIRIIARDSDCGTMVIMVITAMTDFIMVGNSDFMAAVSQLHYCGSDDDYSVEVSAPVVRQW